MLPHSFSFFLFFSLAMLDMDVAQEVKAAPTLYLFGDSIFDVGTNNFLSSSRIKAKYFPYYGIDFHHSVPTGRFSNGLNTADQIGKYINLNNEFPYKIKYRMELIVLVYVFCLVRQIKLNLQNCV